MKEQVSSLTLLVENLSRDFGAHAAVQNINLELRRGEVLGFLGPNGAGKTTTMRMLTGNLAPSTGRIEICGVDLLDKPRDAKQHIGYLPETPPLYQEMTVDKYLQFVAQLHRLNHQDIRAGVDRAKQRCGLGDKGRHLISTLSKGYQQRVGIAQAIVHDPDIIILDEPTVGLDPNQMREMRALIRQLGSTSSVILSTHILPEIESVCDRVQIMHQGRMVLNETLVGLKQQEISLETVFSELTLVHE